MRNLTDKEMTTVQKIAYEKSGLGTPGSGPFHRAMYEVFIEVGNAILEALPAPATAVAEPMETVALHLEVKRLCMSHDIIGAIKLIRAEKNVGLKAAKDYVDAFRYSNFLFVFSKESQWENFRRTGKIPNSSKPR